MFREKPLESKELLSICNSIFATGEYHPRSTHETGLLKSLGFELSYGKLTLPTDIEYLDRAYLGQELLSSNITQHPKQIEVQNCVGSTNLELLDRTSQGDIHGTVLIAELQIAGRGRFSRVWYSPVGRNVALSLGVHMIRQSADAGAASLVVGVAVVRAIQEIGVDRVTLKWPNDILLDEGKVGGVLVELLQANSSMKFVVGIGLNLGGSDLIREIVAYPVADLLDYCQLPIRNELIAVVVRNVYDALAHFEKDGFQPFYTECNELNVLRDRTVSITVNQEQIHGVARDIGPTGELCIELANGAQHYVIAGEVSLT